MSLLMLLVGSETADTTPPAGDPSSVTLSYYGGTLIRATWTNGDATASTELGWGGSHVGEEPTSADFVASPGVTTMSTGVSGTLGAYATGTYLWARHTKNSQSGDWVRSSNGYV